MSSFATQFLKEQLNEDLGGYTKNNPNPHCSYRKYFDKFTSLSLQAHHFSKMMEYSDEKMIFYHSALKNKKKIREKMYFSPCFLCNTCKNRKKSWSKNIYIKEN